MSTDAARSIIKHGLAGTPGMANPATRLLADIRQSAPAIIARSGEIETARRLPPDLVDALRSIGVFHMFVPRSHDLPEDQFACNSRPGPIS